MSAVLVGIDIGTQSLKAAAVAPTMRVLGEASVPYPARYPRPGWAEQDPTLWERALAPAIAEALGRASVPPDAVVALGVAGQLDGCVPTDADGAPRGPCLIWSDRRAAAEAARAPADEIRRRGGVTADGSHMAAKIAWLGPDSAARFHQPTSFLVARLTGEHVFDHGLASTTMLYDLATGDFDDGLLAAFGIARARLPRIAAATALAGRLHAGGARLTGLPLGTPVAVGTGDDFSTPLGAGITRPGVVACVLGTAEVVGALALHAVIDASGLVETHAYPGGLAFVENPGWLSGGAVAWLARTLRLAGADELDALAAQVPAGADGVSFIPALTGAMAPAWVASARGCFYGLDASHGPGHLARALLEGCAFAMRDVLERLAELGVATDAVRLLGGGARSALWARIRADVARLPVQTPASVDTSPVGAAMLAAVASGLAPDLVSVSAPSAAPPEVAPCADDAATYDAAYARYRRLFDSLAPMFA